MKIFKYELRIEEHQKIGTHVGAQVLDMQCQAGQLVVWMAVDPTMPTVYREFSIVGTGHDIPDGVQTYVATAQRGSLVWHLFDGGEIYS